MVEFIKCDRCDTALACSSQQKCYFRNAVVADTIVPTEEGNQVQSLGDVLQEFGEHADSPLQDTAPGAHALSVQEIDEASDAQSNAALLASVAETVHIGSEEISLQEQLATLQADYNDLLASRNAFVEALDKSRDAYNELLRASSVESAAEREITRIVELYRKSEISGTLKLSVEAQCSSGARDCELEFCCSVEWGKEVKANTLDAAYETAARRYWQDKAMAPKRIAFAG